MRQNYLAVWKMLLAKVRTSWTSYIVLKTVTENFEEIKTKFHLINGMLNSSKKEILKVIVMKNILGKMGITELMPQVTGTL